MFHTKDSESSKHVAKLTRFCLLAIALCLTARMPLSTSFTPPGAGPLHPRVAENPTVQHEYQRFGTSVVLRATFDAEADVQQRLARAKEMLAKSKAKLKRREEKTGEKEDSDAAAVPFFAAKSKKGDSETRRKLVIKATNDETGLVQADGAKMAELSEKEEWEIRSVLGAFGTDKEDIENAEIYAKATESLSDRDAMANMWNLRKRMKTEDYEKIFDKRNFFIGEDT